MLIPNWESAWRFTSNITAAILAIANAATAANWFGLQQLITPAQWASFNVAMGILIIVCRVIQQSPPVSPAVKDALIKKVEELPTKETK